MINIRKANNDDLKFIKEMYLLLDKTMMDLYNKLVTSYGDKDEEDSHTDEYWINLIEEKKGYILIAEEDCRCAGISVIENVDKYEVHLEDLILLPNFRGRGIGNLLIKESKKIAIEKGYKKMSLNVLANNDNAKHLYQKEKFKDVKISMICDL